jgi:hypothetical protein
VKPNITNNKVFWKDAYMVFKNQIEYIHKKNVYKFSNNNIYNNEWEKLLLNEIIIHTQKLHSNVVSIINKQIELYNLSYRNNIQSNNKKQGTNYPHMIHPTKLLHIFLMGGAR